MYMWCHIQELEVLGNLFLPMCGMLGVTLGRCYKRHLSAGFLHCTDSWVGMGTQGSLGVYGDTRLTGWPWVWGH